MSESPPFLRMNWSGFLIILVFAIVTIPYPLKSFSIASSDLPLVSGNFLKINQKPKTQTTAYPQNAVASPRADFECPVAAGDIGVPGYRCVGVSSGQ